MNVTFISDEASQIPMEVCWLAKKLAHQLGQRFTRRRYRAIKLRSFPIPTGKRNGDRIFVYVQRHNFRRFTHGLLLLAGDRSLDELPFFQR